MREDILIPVILLSFGAAYVLVYRSLSLSQPHYRVFATAFFTVLFTTVALFMYTGTIRPFYTMYILMVFWIILQRLYLVRASSESGASYES